MEMATKLRPPDLDRPTSTVFRAGIAAIGASLFLLTACSSGGGLETQAAGSVAATPVRQDTLETGTTLELENEAGSTIPEAEHPDETSPAEDVVTTESEDPDEPSPDDEVVSTTPEFEYPDDPPPAEEIVSTLCNLDQEYIGSLRAESADGRPVVDENLRLAVISMMDNLLLWDSLRPHYPETGDAIDTAWRIHDLWHEALLFYESGDAEAASLAMEEADREISNLPSVDSADSGDCVADVSG